MLDAKGYERGIAHLIRLRWVASAAALGAMVLGATLRPGQKLGPALAVAVLIPVSNLAHRALARGPHPPRRLLLIQFGTDIVLLTAFVGCLGGVDGPTIPLYLFHVLLAALLLSTREAFAVTSWALVHMGLMALAQVLHAPFPLRNVHFYSTLLGLDPPLATLDSFVVGQAMTLIFVASVSLVLLMPLARQARERGLKLEAAESHARAQTSALETILDNVGAMMMVLDDQHRVQWLNRVTRQRFPSIEIGQRRICFDPAEPMGGKSPPQCPTCRALETGTSWSGDYAMAVPGSPPLVFHIYATPFSAPSAASSVVELIVDVTGEREMLNKLTEARKTAGIAQLAAGVAHEMNTPLASIAAGLRTVQRACEATATKEDGGCSTNKGERQRILSLVVDLATETNRCQRITDALLGYSRELRSRIETVELEAIIRGALADLGARRDLKGIEVVHEAPPPGTPAIHCDPDHLRLVLVNLLTNAVDSVAGASRSKGRVHVGVQVPAGGDVVEIHVKDNGTGMEPSIQERAFDPFFTTKPVGQGSGLGLAVSRGLLESMGASISVHSEPGRGADAITRLKAHQGSDGGSGGSNQNNDGFSLE